MPKNKRINGNSKKLVRKNRIKRIKSGIKKTAQATSSGAKKTATTFNKATGFLEGHPTAQDLLLGTPQPSQDIIQPSINASSKTRISKTKRTTRISSSNNEGKKQIQNKRRTSIDIILNGWFHIVSKKFIKTIKEESSGALEAFISGETGLEFTKAEIRAMKKELKSRGINRPLHERLF